MNCLVFGQNSARPCGGDMVNRIVRTTLMALIVGWPLSVASAQEPPGTWQEAVRLVDSISPADTVAAIDKLQTVVGAEHTAASPPPAALTTLALLQLRQQDYEAVAQTLKRLTTHYSQAQLQPRRGAILRISLIVALMREDATAADTAYKDLVRMVASEQGDPNDLKLNAMSIGTVFGMLNVQRAQSPIGTRVLQIGNEQMQVSKLRGIGSNYQAAFEASNERAELLVANLIRIEKEGLEAVTAELERRQEALKQRALELQEQKALTGEVIRNTREQIDQNTQDVRQLARDINAINLKLRQQTPGHPGPKRQPPPPLPSVFSIPVEEYELQNDYDYVVQNGQSVRVPVTRQVRRPQYEIDRDRNRIYDRLRDEHARLMANYQTYDADYTKRLTSWMGEDQRRRTDLNKEKAELEVKRNNLVEANKAIKDEKKDTTKDLSIKRNETEQEEFEVELLDIAVQAHRAGKPHTAFRPQHFEPLNWTQEKILLQKL